MVSSPQSREEIRFLALLSRTQERASNLGQKKKDRLKNVDIDQHRLKTVDIDQQQESNGAKNDCQSEDEYDWRLPKFIETLEGWLEDLKHHPQGPDKDVLKEYHTSVDFLRKVLMTYNNDRMSAAPQEKSPFADSVSPGSRRNSAAKMDSDGRRRSFRESSPMVTHTAPSLGLNYGNHLAVPHGPASTKDTISKEIHQRLGARQEDVLRESLFGEDYEGGLRNRHGNKSDTPDTNDLDSLLRAHHAAQEQTAEEMIALARALKEQVQVANTIIKKDTSTLEKSNDLAERNSAKLATESERLSDARSKFSCRCWIWLLIGTVSITFIVMVWVMKFFRKRKDME